MTRIGILLHLMKSRVEDPNFGRVLGSLHDTITRSGRLLEELPEEDDYSQAVEEDEADFVETIVGSAFVVAQTYITGIVSSVMQLKSSISGGCCCTCPSKKSDVLRWEAPDIAGTGCSLPEGVHSFANFFKHRDEWPKHNWQSNPER